MDAFKEFIISIGIMLGLISPQVDPGLNIKIYKTEEAVCFSLEIENGINSDIEALILAGNKITVRLEILVDRDKIVKKEISHSISYNPLDGYYTIEYEETGKLHHTNNKMAAYTIFTGFYQVQMLSVEEFTALRQKSLHFRAAIVMETRAGFDPAVLWNYKTPEVSFIYKSLREIPY